MKLKPHVAWGIALVVAGPALIALQLSLYALGAPGRVVAWVGALAWFGGPVVVVIGVAMLWRKGRPTIRPSTGPGRLALWLMVAFAGCFLVFIVALAAGLGPDHPKTFFANLYPAIPLLLAGACAVAAGAIAAYAVAVRRERSLFVIGSVAFGILVSIFTAAEIGGGDASGGSGPSRTATPSAGRSAPNGHSNVSVVNLAPGEVRVSFDYAYNNDPNGATITAIAVSPLGSNQQPLNGYEPVVRPIGRGSGHMDVTLTFSQDQLARLAGFSICFAGPGKPDLGCAMTGYGPY